MNREQITETLKNLINSPRIMYLQADEVEAIQEMGKAYVEIDCLVALLEDQAERIERLEKIGLSLVGVCQIFNEGKRPKPVPYPLLKF